MNFDAPSLLTEMISKVEFAVNVTWVTDDSNIASAMISRDTARSESETYKVVVDLINGDPGKAIIEVHHWTDNTKTLMRNEVNLSSDTDLAAIYSTGAFINRVL